MSRKGISTVSRDLSLGELRLILGRIKQADVKICLYIMSQIGLRISDAMQLTAEHFKRREIIIQEKKTGKVNRRTIPAKQATYILKFMIENDVDFSRSTLSTFTKKVNRSVTNAAIDLNLDYNHISSHSFRKTYCQQTYSETKDILLVSKLMNHSSVSITQRYLSIGKEDLEKYSSLNITDLL